jgi:hypothetical protein
MTFMISFSIFRTKPTFSSSPSARRWFTACISSLLLATTLTACGGGGDSAASSAPLSLDKSSVSLEGDLSGQDVTTELGYSAPGAAALVLGSADGRDLPYWINLLYGNGIIRVVATPTVTPGVLSAPLRIYAVDNAGKVLGTQDLSVSFSVRGIHTMAEQVSYEPTAPGVKTAGLIVNTGTQTWTLSSDAPWLTFDKTTVSGNETVQMLVDGAGRTGSLWATVSAQRDGQTVSTTRVNLAVTNIAWSTPDYNWAPTAVRGWTTPSKIFPLSFSGANPVPVTVTSSATWLQVPAQVMSNEAFTATIVPDATMTVSSNIGTITLTANAGSQTLTMRINVVATLQRFSMLTTLPFSESSLTFLSSATVTPDTKPITLSIDGVDATRPATIAVETSHPWVVPSATSIAAVAGSSTLGVTIAANHGLPVGTHTAQVTLRPTSGTYTPTPTVVPITLIVR